MGPCSPALPLGRSRLPPPSVPSHPARLAAPPAACPSCQRASVTLDAGVKIYSYRVDSVHTETFKILGGLGRASGPADEPERAAGARQGAHAGQPSGLFAVAGDVSLLRYSFSCRLSTNWATSLHCGPHVQPASWETAAWAMARRQPSGGGARTS